MGKNKKLKLTLPAKTSTSLTPEDLAPSAQLTNQFLDGTSMLAMRNGNLVMVLAALQLYRYTAKHYPGDIKKSWDQGVVKDRFPKALRVSPPSATVCEQLLVSLTDFLDEAMVEFEVAEGNADA